VRGAIALLLVSVLLESCGLNVSVSFGSPTPTPTSSPSPLPSPTVATPTPTPVPTATPEPVDVTECVDLDRFIASTHAARLAAAGITAPQSPRPLPSPTTLRADAILPQSNGTPPPLGQFVLTSSPVATYTKPGYSGFLHTFQDLGGEWNGQTQALALRSGFLWGFDRTWTAESGPGGFQNEVYEFASGGGAVDYDEGAARGACLSGGSVFEVPGIPGAIGQRIPGGFPDYTLRVSFVRGTRRYAVVLMTPQQMPAEVIFQAARIASSTAR